MLRSLRIASVAGIGIYLHWTFLTVTAIALGVAVSRLDTDPWALRLVAFYGVIFLCVLLHELGHALAAKRYGIRTSRITLLPIGGLAQLESPPKTPQSELVIALAGPAVNVVIATLIAGGVGVAAGATELVNPSTITTGFLRDIAVANTALILFNMIPAFPMDGGRVFRALLSMVSNQRRATRIASSLGKLMAVGFAVVGLFIIPNPILVFVGVFIFLAAGAENRFSELQAQTENRRVSEAMTEWATTIDLNSTACEASRLMLQSGQRDLPVVSGSTYVGMVRRQDVVAVLKQLHDCCSVRDILRPTPAVSPGDDLWDAAAALQHPSIPTIAVIDDGVFVGIVTQSNLRLIAETGLSRMRTTSVRRYQLERSTDQLVSV